MDNERAWKLGKILFPNRTIDYASKETEWRKEWMIRKHLCEGSCMDLGCGPGEYGPILKEVCGTVTGVDLDSSLLALAEKRGSYSALSQKDLTEGGAFAGMSFDYLWASEIVEHMPDLGIIDHLEALCAKKMILTVPNPISPHFKEDPTHILKYSVSSFRKFFGNRDAFSYQVCGLGFNEVPFNLPERKLSTFMLYNIPWLSPTIAVVGARKKKVAG